MPFITEKPTAAAPLTYEALTKLGGLDAIGGVPAALLAAQAARQRLADAEKAIEAARRDPGDARHRRAIQRGAADRRAALLDAQDLDQDAERALGAARRQAFETVAPILREAHVRVLVNDLDPLLAKLQAIADTVLSIERTNSNYMLSGGAHSAPARSALVGEIADSMLERLSAWRRTIAAHRPQAGR
jgi:hypothetical protein